MPALAEIPEGIRKAPAYVREFLRGVPSVWDDTKFLDGHPGKFAVLARRGAGRWYVAGISGEGAEKNPRWIYASCGRAAPARSSRTGRAATSRSAARQSAPART